MSLLSPIIAVCWLSYMYKVEKEKGIEFFIRYDELIWICIYNMVTCTLCLFCLYSFQKKLHCLSTSICSCVREVKIIFRNSLHFNFSGLWTSVYIFPTNSHSVTIYVEWGLSYLIYVMVLFGLILPGFSFLLVMLYFCFFWDHKLQVIKLIIKDIIFIIISF